MRNIKKIIIHCAATPEGKPFTAADIRRMHLQRGFNDIGYHFVIRLDGTVEKGRAISKVGAHTLGQNAYSIGICYIGGVRKDGKTPADTRTPQQKQALLSLLRTLHAKYPKATVHGHNEFANKACPSFTVSRDADITAIFKS